VLVNRSAIALKAFDSFTQFTAFPMVNGRRAEVSAAAMSGCKMSEIAWIDDQYASWELTFPHTLKPGEEFSYGVERTVVHMSPRYTVVPLMGIEEMAISIRFEDPDGVRVYRVDGIPQALNNASYVKSNCPTMTLDRIGSLDSRFSRLR